MRLIIVCVGQDPPPFVDDVAHYERLLARHARIETIELARGPIRERAQGQAILKRIPAEPTSACSTARGERLERGLARLLEERRAGGRDVCFVIGGPFGLSEAVLERADERLSLGAITLPHQLARVVLLEQLFRAHKIVLGEPYHY